MPTTITGLMLTPRRPIDKELMEELINSEGIYAEWNEEWRCWVIPEEPELYDELEASFAELFQLNDIDIKIEAI